MSKKIRIFIGVICTIAIFVLISFIYTTDQTEPALIVKDTNNVDYEKINRYKIDVNMMTEEKKLEVKQVVDYYNNEDVDLKEIYFHLYPNVFENYSITKKNSFIKYPNGVSTGGINLKSIKIDNDDVEYDIKGEDNTLLHIPLQEKLNKDDKITIEFQYEVTLPNIICRFGYHEGIYNLGNWYPIVAVYDESGWNLDPYYMVGDPFYSDTSNYEVNIVTPKNMIIAASGQIKDEIKDDKRHWNIKGDMIRDFAFVASEDFIVKEEVVEGTTIKSYFLMEDNEVIEEAMKYARDSLRVFNNKFGKYPYKTLSVVATNHNSGMEFPSLIYISKNYYKNEDRFLMGLEIVICHEIGHQWWYSVVGNDEIEEAWLDESLTVYSEIVYFNEVYSKKVAKMHVDKKRKQYENQEKSLEDKKVIKSLKDFDSWKDYTALVYKKGFFFLLEIDNKYETGTLDKILREYYNNFRFKNAKTTDFLDICEKHTDKSIRDLADEYLYDKK
ncbi:M1 family metallopeptidase [Clostridiaceae bacterium M8S5]|nr:M1 family metallopeptidase [Clostridiaceae bacterium M8S5]